MFHPYVLTMYEFYRTESQCSAPTACVETAEFYGVPFATLAQFLVAMGIDASRLSLLA